MGRKKERVSASIDADLKDRLDSITEINKSKLIESLLREYLAQGESTTVALHLLRDDLRRRKDGKEVERQLVENEIESLQQQIDDVTRKIEQRREAGLKGVDEIVSKVENGELVPDYINEQNPLIRDGASRAGVPPARYAEEVLARI